MSGNFLITVWKGQRNVLTASSSDAEFVALLKTWAQDNGYRVTVADHFQPKEHTA